MSRHRGFQGQKARGSRVRLALTLFLCGLVCAAAPVLRQGEQARSRGVRHVVLDGPLDIGALAHLQRAVREAKAAGDEAVVIDLDTPGGALDDLWKIIKAIDRASSQGLVLIAWVHDRAMSAGVLVALSCDRIFVSDRATIGAMAPVQIGPAGAQDLPDTFDVRQKQVSYLRAECRTRAEAHRRPAVLAEAMIERDMAVYQIRENGELRLVSGQEWDDRMMRGETLERVRTISPSGELLTLTGSEAVALGFADGRADSLDELLRKSGYAGVVPTDVLPSKSEELLVFLDKISPLLLAAGLLLGYMELKMPGFGLPGILAVACFAVLLAGRYMVGLADIPHIVMVTVGVALVAVEIFLFPGTIWLGLVGGMLVIAGLVLVQVGPGFGVSNPLDRSLLIDAAFNLVLSATLAAVGMWIVSRYLPETPILRRLVLDPGAGGDAFGGAMTEASGERSVVAHVGAHGRAITALRPVGKVVLDERDDLEFEARSDGPVIDAQARVRVVEVSGGRLVVELDESRGEAS